MSNPNWANQTLWTGDNLDIMRGMNSDTVDLIYLDPPFNSNADYAAPIGSEAAGAEFKDTWGLDDINLAWHGLIKHEHPGLYDMLQATHKIHGDSMMSYLIYMAPRIIEMKRLLKPTGSIYLHCDPTASSYLRLTMDAVFGKQNFRNEIIWCYSTSGRSKRFFAKKHDTILLYTESEKGFWGDYRIPVSEEYLESHYRQVDEQGRRCRIRTDAGKTRIYYPEEGMICNDWWEIPYLNSMSKERIGYPTQKPLILLERIIKASSNEGDMVLDPFCGCATACIAAERLGRQWVGIDISAKAADLVEMRMEKDLGLFWQGTHRTDTPERDDLGNVPPYNSIENKKWLYGEQGGHCNACGHHFEMRHFDVDHIIPRSKGGTDHISNLQLLCGNCNSIKGNRSQEWLLSRLLEKDYIKQRLLSDAP